MPLLRYSIIIPTYNQRSKLKQTLHCLTALEFDRSQYEIIVVDNGSTDDTKAVCDSMSGALNNFTYCWHPSPGLMAARHEGLFRSSGDILCYLDDDSLVNTEYLHGVALAFSDPHTVLATGPCIPKYETEPPAWMSRFVTQNDLGTINGYLSLIDFGDTARPIPPEYVFGCNFSIRKEVLLSIGGTHPDYLPPQYSEFVGDGETGVKDAIQKFGTASYQPKMSIRHLVPTERLTVQYFQKRAHYNGVGASYREIRSNAERSLPTRMFLRLLQEVRIRKKQLHVMHSARQHDAAPEQIAVLSSFIEGYRFHRKKVSEHPVLIEWITKKTYLDDESDIREFIVRRKYGSKA